MRSPLAVCLVAVLLITGASAKKSKNHHLKNLKPATKASVPAVPAAATFAAPPALAPIDATAPAPGAPPPPPPAPAPAPEAAPTAAPAGQPPPQNAAPAQTEGSDASLTPDQQASKQAPDGAPASPVPVEGETSKFAAGADAAGADAAGNGTAQAAAVAGTEEKTKEADDAKVIEDKAIRVPKKAAAKALDLPEHSGSALDEEKPTYPSIIKKALIGLQGLGKSSSLDIMEVLEKHFFTGVKEDSVWFHALEESESKLGLEFDERQLFDMQSTVKNVYRKMLECELPSLTTDNKAECILGVLEFIDDGLQTFGVLRMNDQEQAKMMELNLAFKVMSINVLQIVKNIAEKGKVNDLKAIKYLLDIGESLYDGLQQWTENTINWRLDAVDQPQVCNVQQVMWEEFTVGCVYRYPTSPKRGKRDVGSYGGIGGSKDNFQRRYKAKVLDKVTGDEVFSQTESTDAKNKKEAVVEKLVKSATESRDKYVQVLKDDLKKFYGERTGTVLKEITKLWEKKKAKLQGMREQIKNHHLI